jgi:hypothetical protein
MAQDMIVLHEKVQKNSPNRGVAIFYTFVIAKGIVISIGYSGQHEFLSQRGRRGFKEDFKEYSCQAVDAGKWRSGSYEVFDGFGLCRRK